MSSSIERARHNALRRYRSPDDPVVVDARRDLKVARAAEYVRDLVDAAPVLTAEQRSRLAVLLLTGPTAPLDAAADGEP